MAKGPVERLRIPLSRCFIAGIVALVALSDSAWTPRGPTGGAVLFCLGVVLAALGAMGRLWCSLYIGGRKSKSLVTVGPYSLCRNPLYLFSLIGVLGVGMTSETLTIPLIAALGFGAYYPLVIRAEERKLQGRHGDAFEEYRRRVPRFIPRLVGFQEPQQYTVHPVLFRKSLVSALWFVWLIGGMRIVKLLHALDAIPTWFLLY
ncbi:MAG: isoprenylcysteine carboxylmethyltransferase family protein [Pirellulaceae bacterium]|nr:isoprenylcysteine carboxylmethyltransferase family protein [Pirellulaceae bacterium]